MSAIHTGRIEVRTVNGRQQFCTTAVDHAVPGWPEPTPGVPAFIPKQRAGSDYERVVLTPVCEDLADLSDLVQIPTFGRFVRQMIAATAGEETQP